MKRNLLKNAQSEMAQAADRCRSVQRRLRRSLTGLLSILASLCLMFASVLPCYGAERKTYTYTVTFSAGNQGTLSLEDGVSISVDGGGDYEISLSQDGKTVKITGLTADNSVRFLNSAVNLAGDSKYYVRGVRMGGRDNNTVALSYFPVERDQDYVVAYGIKGNLVQYTINYVDQEGNQLYPPQTYYGNIGDKPVVAYLYVEGYQPQAYNLTGTLQSDASKNVFTFVYRPVPVIPQAPDQGGNTPGDDTPGGNAPGSNTPGGNVPGGNTPGGNVPGGNTPGGNAPGGNTPGGNIPGGDNPDDQNNPDAPNPPDDENNPGGQEIPDDDIPQNEPGEPQQVIDMDDEDVPMGSFNDDGTIAAANRTRLRNTWIAAGIGVLAVLVLAAGAYFYGRMRKAGKKADDSRGNKSGEL